MEVCAKIEVVSVKEDIKDGEVVSTKGKDFGDRKNGFEVQLKTFVVRVQDDAIIAEGTHTVWFHNFLRA